MGPTSLGLLVTFTDSCPLAFYVVEDVTINLYEQRRYCRNAVVMTFYCTQPVINLGIFLLFVTLSDVCLNYIIHFDQILTLWRSHCQLINVTTLIITANC